MAIQANEITVRLTVQDDATRPLNRTQRELDETGREGREAFVKIQVAADRAGRELKDFESKSNRTRISIAKLATGIIGVAAAFEGIRRTVGTGLGFIQAASEFEEAAAKFGVVFGDEAGRVAEDFENLSSVVRRSQVELVTAASSFQDLFVPMGLSREAAADLSTEMVKLAVDVASFNNAQDVDVIRNFQSALVGETEAVRKYGVLLDEARLKQLAYQNGIADAGAELTQQQKVLTRILALYADTTDAQGDAARTADSFANTIKGIRGAAKDLEVVFGQELVAATRDVLEELGGVQGATDLIKVGFAAATTVTEKFIQIVGSALRVLKNAIDELGGTNRVIALLRGEFDLTGRAIGKMADAFAVSLTAIPPLFEALVGAMRVFGRNAGEEFTKAFGQSTTEGIARIRLKLTLARDEFLDALNPIGSYSQKEVFDRYARFAEGTVAAFKDGLGRVDIEQAGGELAVRTVGLVDVIRRALINEGLQGPELDRQLRESFSLITQKLARYSEETRVESLRRGGVIEFAPDLSLDQRRLTAFFDELERVVPGFAQASRQALEDNFDKLTPVEIDILGLTRPGGDAQLRAQVSEDFDRVNQAISSAVSELRGAVQSLVGEGRGVELKVSDFFKTPETSEIVSFVTDFFGKVQAVQNQKAQELAAAFGINLFDMSGIDPDAASGKAVEVVRQVAAKLGNEGEAAMSAAGAKAGLAFNRALAKAAEDFVPAEDPLIGFLQISEQTEQIQTLNAILAGTFDEAAAKVTDYYDGLREAAIARANASRESQQLLLDELDLLGKLEERDKQAVENAKAKEDAIRAFGEALGDQAVAVQLQLGLEQQFQQLIAGLSRSFVDSEASFADFRDAFLQGIAQMIVQALILKSLTLLFGGTAFGNFLGLGAPGAAKGGVFTGVGSMAVGDAPGVTKGDGGTNGTFYFAKGGVMPGSMSNPIEQFAKGGIMPGSMGLPIKKYATGGVARTPQLAVFGEGRGAEAFVPLPDGARIPVKMEGGAQEVTVNLSVQSLDPRGAADVVLAQMPLIRKEIAGALREGSDRTLLEGVRGASRR